MFLRLIFCLFFLYFFFFFFFSSRRRHTRLVSDWSSDVCSSDLGKTFKGMTDEMLEWQTAKLLELETRRDGHVVHVRPELVVEVAFNGIQASPTYPGGLALRFARIVRYRPDKGPDQSDTIETVRELHQREVGET